MKITFEFLTSEIYFFSNDRGWRKNQNNVVDLNYIYNFTVETFLFEFIRGLKYSFET